MRDRMRGQGWRTITQAAVTHRQRRSWYGMHSQRRSTLDIESPTPTREILVGTSRLESRLIPRNRAERRQIPRNRGRYCPAYIRFVCIEFAAETAHRSKMCINPQYGWTGRGPANYYDCNQHLRKRA
jgi:hypothetical protein